MADVSNASSSLAAKADLLRGLRHAPQMLVLPNGWDAASARAFAAADAPINVLAWRNPLPLTRLAEIGGRRVTFASGLFHELMTTLTASAEALRAGYPSANDA